VKRRVNLKLEFKPDFAATAGRWDAYWKGENKRPIIKIMAPKNNGDPIEKPRWHRHVFEGIEAVMNQVLTWGAAYDFVGEYMPFYWFSYGPDTFAGYLGAELRFQPGFDNTSWSIPFVKDWDDTGIKFHREGEWWQKTLETMSVMKKTLDGKMLITPPDLSANLDALAAIRGIENLLLDMVEQPDKIKRALSAVCDVYDEISGEFAKMLEYEKYGSAVLEGTYASGRQDRVQCDMSCMISPDMFKEFAVPALEREVASGVAGIYHLDGPGAVKHIDALCGIDKMRAILFVSGAGGENTDWTWLREKIDGQGRGHWWTINDHEELKRLCRETDMRRAIVTTDAASKTEAECLIADIDKICG